MQQGHFIESKKKKEKNDSKVFRDLSMVGKWKGTRKKKLRSWGRTKKKYEQIQSYSRNSPEIRVAFESYTSTAP